MVPYHFRWNVDGFHADDASVMFTGDGDGEVMKTQGEEMSCSSRAVHTKVQCESPDGGPI